MKTTLKFFLPVLLFFAVTFNVEAQTAPTRPTPDHNAYELDSAMYADASPAVRLANDMKKPNRFDYLTPEEQKAELARKAKTTEFTGFDDVDKELDAKDAKATEHLTKATAEAEAAAKEREAATKRNEDATTALNTEKQRGKELDRQIKLLNAQNKLLDAQLRFISEHKVTATAVPK